MRIAAEARTDESFELIATGAGIVVLAAGNAQIYDHPGIVCRRVSGITPSQLAVARRREDHRIPVRALIDACTAILTRPASHPVAAAQAE